MGNGQTETFGAAAQQEIKNIVSKEFFVMKRTRFAYFFGGVIGFAVAVVGLSWASAYQSVEAVLSDTKTKMTIAFIDANAKTAAEDTEKIATMLKAVSSQDAYPNILAAGSKRVPKAVADVDITLPLPSLLILQGTLFAPVPSSGKFPNDGKVAAVSVWVDGVVCEPSRGVTTSAASDQYPLAITGLCILPVKAGSHHLRVGENAGFLAGVEHNFEITYLAIGLGHCLNTNGEFACQ